MTTATFPILEAENYRKTKRIRTILVVAIAIGFLLIGRKGSFALLRILGLEGYEPVVLLVFTVLSITFLLFYIYSRITKKKGALLLTHENILISGTDRNYTVLIKDLITLTITHNSYVGDDFHSRHPSNFKGDNWIEFSTADRKDRVEFEVNSRYKSVQLENIVKELQHHYPSLIYKVI